MNAANEIATAVKSLNSNSKEIWKKVIDRFVNDVKEEINNDYTNDRYIAYLSSPQLLIYIKDIKGFSKFEVVISPKSHKVRNDLRDLIPIDKFLSKEENSHWVGRYTDNEDGVFSHLALRQFISELSSAGFTVFYYSEDDSINVAVNL